MKIPEWCKDCESYIKSDRGCEWHGPTKPFRKGCKDYTRKQQEAQHA